MPYRATIVWDVDEDDDVQTPRAAAEKAWHYVRTSEGPIVEVVAPDGVKHEIDLYDGDEPY